MSLSFKSSGCSPYFVAKGSTTTLQAWGSSGTVILHTKINGKTAVVGSFLIGGCEMEQRSFKTKPGNSYRICVNDPVDCVTVEVIYDSGGSASGADGGASGCEISELETVVMQGLEVDPDFAQFYVTLEYTDGANPGESQLLLFDRDLGTYTKKFDLPFLFIDPGFHTRQFNAAGYDSANGFVPFIYTSSNNTFAQDELYIYNEATEVVTLIGTVVYSTGASNQPKSGFFDVIAGNYYIGDPSGTGAGKLFEVDLATAAATEVAGFAFSGDTTQSDAVIGSDGALYYTATGEIWTVPAPWETETHVQLANDFGFTSTNNLSIDGTSLFSINEATGNMEERSTTDGSLINTFAAPTVPNPDGYTGPVQYSDATEGRVAQGLPIELTKKSCYACGEEVIACYWEENGQVYSPNDEQMLDEAVKSIVPIDQRVTADSLTLPAEMKSYSVLVKATPVIINGVSYDAGDFVARNHKDSGNLLGPIEIDATAGDAIVGYVL